MRNSSLYWRKDEVIRAPELRVIGADGKQLGILKREEALSLAKEQRLTLVEIAPNAVPPVAKIVEFGKFRYQEEKKARSQHKRTKGGEIKEIRFSPFIAQNDYRIRLNRIKGFLEQKDKVRLVVVFKTQQMRSKQFGYNLINRIKSELGDEAAQDMVPKFLGKHLITVISPLTHAKTKNKEVAG